MDSPDIDGDLAMGDALRLARSISATSTLTKSDTHSNPIAEVTRASQEQFDTSFENRQYPHFPLSRFNVLDYFSASPFYDKTCNNEIIRSQNRPLEALKQMTGLEYATYSTKHEPRLFVIVKQIRSSESSVVKRALYYVLDQIIFQSPNVRQVCLRRIRSASENLSKALEFFNKHRQFSCVEGRHWNFPNDSAGVWRRSAESARLHLKDENKRVKRMRGVYLAMDYALDSTMKELKKDEPADH